MASAVVRLGLAGGALAALTSVAEAQPVTQRQESVGRTVATPLEDLNLRKVEIPGVLQRAVTDPYVIRGLTGCAAVAAEVGRLDAALGPDRDQAQAPEEKGAGATAMGLVRAGAEGVVPYRGWLRRLSGAAAHEARVREAVNAGAARRGYLKGMGMRMNCAPPAAPSWFKPAPPRRAPAPRPTNPAPQNRTPGFTLPSLRPAR